MAAELPRPGVEVVQTFAKPAPTFVRPTLAPCVVGPAFEVINVLNTDGTLNSKAKYGTYGQLGLAITQSSFPDPRNNIDELDILEETVRPFMLAGGQLSEMRMSPYGQGFLTTSHGAGRAAMRSGVFGGVGLALGGLTLVVAIDQPVRLSTTKDVAITFTGGTINATNAAAQINAAVGSNVATVTGTSPNEKVQIASTIFGSLSSVTVRKGGSANQLLTLGWVSGASAEERVEASGYRGQDDNDNDTMTPWIEFYQGEYYVDGVATAYASGRVGMFNIEDQANFVSAKAAALSFGSSPGQIPILVGDYFYGDGLRVKNGEIAKIESARFKVGTINTALSTADANGNYTEKVYDIQEVGTPFDASPFAPQYTYFKANDLDWEAVAPVAMSLKGSVSALAATAGQVTGTGAGAGPFSLAGLNLHWVATVNGVESEGLFTFTGGPFADEAGPTGTGDSIGGTAPTMTLTDAAAAFTAGLVGRSITISGATTPANNGTFPIVGYTSGTVISYTNASGVPEAFTGSYTISPLTAMEKVAAAIGTSVTGSLASSTTPGVSGGQLRFTTTGTGRLNDITIKKDGTANSFLGFSTSSDTTGQGVDASFSGLSGETLKFQLDKNPHIYEVSFSSDSLDLAVDEINDVVGYTVASKDTGGVKLVLTSPLKGMGSYVSVMNTATPAASVFGFASPTVTSPSGRPYPDVYFDDALVLNVNSEIIRDVVTGYPLDQTYNAGTLYIQFKALRKDVSPVAEVAGVLRLTDVDTLTSVLDPITEENPLGLGLFMAMINAPTFEVKGLGIDTVTAAAPEGTSEAWARAAGLLESEEVYSLAPLTQDEVVIQLWGTHVGVMSQPEQGGERIVFINKKMPVRKNPTIAASGSSANSTATPNQLSLDQDPSAGLVAAGINPANPITEAMEVYIEVTVSGELRRYSVSSVSGALVNLRSSFTTDVNVDGFYSTTTLNVSVVNSPYSLKVRGASLNVPGSNPARLDYQLVAETVAEANAAYKNRRLYSIFPDTVKTTIQGTEKSLPGYYACAAIAGMCASQPPQQGFTNFPMTGLTGVVGTEKFTKRQLNIMAGGGTYILIQDAIGAPVSSRHQLSTDLTSIETRELSITKVVDFVAKFLRVSVRKFIGVNVINKDLLDSLGTTIHAALKFLEEVGVLNGSNINQIVQDTTNPDTVLVDVTLDVPFPCNYIRITLVV